MAETTRIQSLNVLLDGSVSGKMLLKEAYDGVIANVQKNTVSSRIKNTDLSGDPDSGTVEAKRFANASSQDYGTAMNLFTNGQAAMFYMGSWETSMATNEDIPEEIRTNIRVFTMPIVKDGKGTATDIAAWNGGGYAVSNDSEVKEAELLRWGRYQQRHGKTQEEAKAHNARCGVNYFPLTVSAHIRLLKQTGFRHVHVFWYSYMQMGIYGVK